MGNTLNKVMLIGRLGKDPVIRNISEDRSVANFTLATDESYKKEGETIKKTEWVNVVSWLSVPFISEFLHAGDLIYVEGKLQTRSWEPKDGGTTRYTTEVNVSDIRPLQTRKSDSGGTSTTTTKSAPATRRPAPAEISDEDIPF